MTREEAFEEINKTQDMYVAKLAQLIDDPANQSMKSISFTSPTGTGKTKMMAKLINKFPERYFIVTTLSKSQLKLQVEEALAKDCKYKNYSIYGLMDYRINSRLQAGDITRKVSKGKECIWLRDEGHIETNRYAELLESSCYKIINFSATNFHSDIQCNFTHTMMLRTVNQQMGTPKMAIEKLMQIKESHRGVKDYNPCAIFRCISHDSTIYDQVIELCKKNGLKYIDISNDDYSMPDLCKDNNEFDVIINKYKLVEGIDIRRAHVLYMDSYPKNDTTTIQAIGRCRRNALLYREDIDLLSPENRKLLKETRECFVFYNKEMLISEDENGELCYAFCPYISCENLKAGIYIEVENGQLPNGLYVQELQNKSGKFQISKDDITGFNVISPETDFYDTKGLLQQQYSISEDELVNKLRQGCGRIVNDRESAIIGVDKFQPIRANSQSISWVESKAITSKINSFTKLNRFITHKYSDELQEAKKYCFTGKNTFSFDRKCNSMIGYCVEYYSKYIVYGKSYINEYIAKAKNELIKLESKNQKINTNNDAIIIRACMLKYKEEVTNAYGNSTKMLIKTASIEKLVTDEYQEFISLIISLGTKTAIFVMNTLYNNKRVDNTIDPNLSIRHISGLADYISEDTILDVKVTNHINETNIKQVLAYHYLSTKRDGLHIKRVIVYDAVSGKSVIINITEKNYKYNAYEEWNKNSSQTNKKPQAKIKHAFFKKEEQKISQTKNAVLITQGKTTSNFSDTELQRIERLKSGKANVHDFKRLIRAYYNEPIVQNACTIYGAKNINTCLRRMSELQQKQLGEKLWLIVSDEFNDIKTMPHI